MKPFTIAALFAFLATAGLPLAQEEEEPAPATAEELFGGDDLQQEMIELFHRVERNLIRIDAELSDAGAGFVPVEEVGESGLAELLRSTGDRSRSVVDDIDRMLEIAQQMGQQSLGSCTNPMPSGESPLDEERDTGPQERERTPEGPPQEEQGGNREEEQGEEPNGSQDPQPTQNPPGGENRQGDADRQDGTGPGSDSDDAQRWGELPVRFQERFRNQGGEGLPVQYRDWIDSYYRRLNEKPR